MTVEADLFTALRGLVADRVFPDMAPEGTALPFIVYQQVGGAAPVFMERAVPSLQNGRFQISVWSASRVEAKSLALQAESALTLATAFQAKPLLASVADFEPETNRYGSRQDFSIWSPR